MKTADIFKHYMIFPKIIFPDFAVFYASEDLAMEIKLEVEQVIGKVIKFESVSDEKILQFIGSMIAKDGISIR